MKNLCPKSLPKIEILLYKPLTHITIKPGFAKYHEMERPILNQDPTDTVLYILLSYPVKVFVYYHYNYRDYCH